MLKPFKMFKLYNSVSPLLDILSSIKRNLERLYTSIVSIRHQNKQHKEPSLNEKNTLCTKTVTENLSS